MNEAATIATEQVADALAFRVARAKAFEKQARRAGDLERAYRHQAAAAACWDVAAALDLEDGMNDRIARLKQVA